LYLHIGQTAGIGSTLAKYQKRVGINAKVLSTGPNPFQYPVDIQTKKYIAYLHLLRANIWHFHGRWKPVHRLPRKKIILHYHGSDLRLYAKKVDNKADCAIVVSPDLIEFTKNAKIPVEWIPNPLDFEDFPFAPLPTSDKITIFHAPTKPEYSVYKGTSEIRQTVKELMKKYPRLNYVEISHVPHNQMYNYYLKSDIVIDQTVRWYGMVGLEALATGRPTIAHLREDLLSYFPSAPPFYHLSDLETLIQDEDLRKQSALKGRKWVETFHSPISAVEKISAVLETIKRK